MKNISNICVFCGSKVGENQQYENDAKKFGALLGEKNIGLVYGGGRIGLMGIIADAVSKAGGKVTGVIPEFLMNLEIGNEKVDELIITDSMHDRKKTMYQQSNGFVSFPGGVGTLDETLEIISWKQLRLHNKPIVLYNCAGYWEGLEALIEKTISCGFAHQSVQELFTIANTLEEIFFALDHPPKVGDEVLTSHL